MEENTITPYTDKTNEPQNREEILNIEKKKSKTLDTDSFSDKTKDKKKSEENTSEEIHFSLLELDDLINAYESLSNGVQWHKDYKQIQMAEKTFEVKFNVDLENQKKIFLGDGGEEIDFFYKPEYKKRFDQISYKYRKKRHIYYKELETSQKVNLERRLEIIEEIKKLINVDQNINNIYKDFKTLQESWYNIGNVSRSESQNLWETYKHHVERFYDFLHLNRELRDLDFKHNFKEKLKIIKKAEALKNQPDVVKASRDLNTLHKLWKNDLGPVANEHREDLWKRFQDASKIIQNKRQAYQKDIAGAMKANLVTKEALLKEMKVFSEKTPENHKEWQNAIKKFHELRELFKTIGYVPSKESKSTWQEFREIGQEFMQLKNMFYKERKQEYSKNIENKKSIIKRSKEVIDSESWESKTEEIKDFQKKWKTVGFIPRKLDNKLWSEFSDLQKVYFDRLKSGYQRLSSEQKELQKNKLASIEKLKNSIFSEDPDTLKKEFHEHWKSWNTLGKLAEANEEKMYHSFSNALQFGVKNVNLDKKVKNEILKDLKSLLLQGNSKRLQKELQIARTTLLSLKAELTQLENNLAFFSDSSSSNPLFKNVEKQIKNCENNILKANEGYISLKQIRNSQNKQVKQAEESVNLSAEKETSEEA